MTDLRVYVAQDTLEAAGEGTWVAAKASKMGYQVVMDWYTQMALEGRIYQVQAGTVTTPLTGDIDVTDTKAEMCADAATGYTIIPTCLRAILESHSGGTLSEITAKSAAAISTAGAVFVPLPLYTGGVAAATTARVAAAGGVTVAAELATTTRRHFYNQMTAVSDGRVFADKEFRGGPVLAGPACFYVQVTAVTAGPVYFADFDYVELPTASVS